ncbi:MAG: hypothetical protein LBH17_06250 [Oscillospiraceae bacterium]|jgi:hypothetical protein|nr:hypothetical protein [Oscillospiraceae bacterium]
MRAYRAYYEDGRFVPFEAPEIPDGSHAIVTVLDDYTGGSTGVSADAWQTFLYELENIFRLPYRS